MDAAVLGKFPQITHTDSLGGRAVISFRTQPGPNLTWGGFELRPENVMRHRVDGSSYQHSSGSTSVGAMSLPLEDMASVGAVIAGCDLTPPLDARVATPQSAAMAKLQRLHAAAAHLAEVAPGVIAHPEAARGLEQALTEAMIACLTTIVTVEERSAQRRHEHIMRRFHELIEHNLGRPLFVPGDLPNDRGFSGNITNLLPRAAWYWPRSDTCSHAACILRKGI